MAYHLILFDDNTRENFLPLAWTRPLADMRVGHLTIREKWEKWLKAKSTTSTVDHLAKYKWKFQPDAAKSNLWINGRLIPSPEIVAEIMKLGENEALLKGDTVVALNRGKNTGRLELYSKDHLSEEVSVKVSHSPAILLHRIHDIFLQNGKAINEDLLHFRNDPGEMPGKFNRVIGDHPVIFGKNVKAECALFNASGGPIIIGDNAEIMEGSLLRGPLSIGENAVIKMGAKIYGDTTIGPGCKVGGEITNSVFFANSNKAHDGYIGNSVIGEWVNLGADTNCSNLKNNYGNVSVYNYSIDGEEDTGLQFHGAIVGDHAKCGINTMINTGTIIGSFANIFGSGFPPKFLPDFAWGGAEGLTETAIEKAIENVQRVYKRRNITLEDAEKDLFREIFRLTAASRKQRIK